MFPYRQVILVLSFIIYCMLKNTLFNACLFKVLWLYSCVITMLGESWWLILKEQYVEIGHVPNPFSLQTGSKA